MDNYVVEMEDIHKSFGKVHAVSGASFNLRKGEIHSLIGENGAGKSTMMKLLYGMYPIDSGRIRINQEDLSGCLSPKAAIEHGIGMVHQEFMLVNELTVMENIILGFEPRRGISIDFKQARARIQEYIDRYGLSIEPNKKITQISVGQAQRVEIIKTLLRGATTIILDEPTGVLAPQEVTKLFEILNGLREAGNSIVFISHKLNEVLEISDRISVMRDSRYMGTVNGQDTNVEELTKMMIGRNVMLDVERVPPQTGQVVLRVEGLWAPGDKEKSKLRDVSLQVHSGEIVGIAGVDGNGQSELAEAIAGLRTAEKGKIEIAGQEVTKLSPKKRRDKGLAHIPEDRNVLGLNRSASTEINMAVIDLDKKPFHGPGGAVNKKAIRENALTLIKEFDVRPANPETLTSALSGGNAQKVVVARELAQGKRFLIAAQPTRGIDVGAIELIRNYLVEEKKKGTGGLLISTELEEVMTLSDRILVMYEGKIAGELDGAKATELELGRLMLGGGE
ncbi:MAG: ABC transporter ATP-binding protein [Lachnospiraceae bacterium]|nr:ABC transporter ATP-binding protein [Lachnospiraceae bacterium]